MRNKLFNLGYFTLDESAYAIEPFIFPPYDNAKSELEEDAYNVYQSST